MTLSTPNIADATGHWDSGGGFGDIFILWNNSGGYGYVKLEAGNYDTNTIHNITVSCFDVKIGLYWKTRVPLNNAFNFGFARAYRCNSDSEQNCSPPTCSRTIQTSSALDFPIYAANYSTPPTPTGLNVIVGDRQLEFTWNASSGIFTYHLALTDPLGNVIEKGHKPLNERRYVFHNLTNGVTYTLHLQTISHSSIASNEATLSGKPVAPPCNTPSCGLVIA